MNFNCSCGDYGANVYSGKYNHEKVYIYPHVDVYIKIFTPYNCTLYHVRIRIVRENTNISQILNFIVLFSTFSTYPHYPHAFESYPQIVNTYPQVQ